MTENFTTPSKRSETSKNSEKYSFELNQNSNEYSFDYFERISEYSVYSF